MTKKIKVKKLQGSNYAISEQQIIGKGQFGVIMRAYDLSNPQQQLAAKIISIKDEETNLTIKSELQIMKQLPIHPNLVNYKKIQILSQNNLYLIMEYCNEGNLDKYMYNCKNQVPQEKIWFFLKQFCQGYKVLYEHNLVHRDIKPQNILIHNGDFKIADFGLARAIDHPEITENISSKGTPLYMAPELHQEKEGSSKIDIFSLGIVLYKLSFEGKFPFFDQGRRYRSIGQYFKELMLKVLVFPENHHRSPQLVDLITKMLTKDKQARIGWKQLFEHQRIKKAVRNERKKEISTMHEFKKSLIFANQSITKVQIIRTPSKISGSQTGSNQKHEKEEQEVTHIILEEAFNKTGKSQFQKKLYRNKMLYTLIEYTNKKIQMYLHKQNKHLHPHVKKSLENIIYKGLEYCLFMLNSLEDVSGDWSQINPSEIMNFQDIFENDKLILEDQLFKIQNKGKYHKKQENQELPPVFDKKFFIQGAYEDKLYLFLTEFIEYPHQLRMEIRSIVYFLSDIYDLVIRQTEKNYKFQENQKSQFDFIEDAEINLFYEYLLDAEKVKQIDLIQRMSKKGLIFK